MLEKRLGISPSVAPSSDSTTICQLEPFCFSQSQTTKFETLGCSINPDLLQWPAISEFPERQQQGAPVQMLQHQSYY